MSMCVAITACVMLPIRQVKDDDKGMGYIL